MKFLYDLVFILAIGTIVLIPFLFLKGAFYFTNILNTDEKIELFYKNRKFICSSLNSNYLVSKNSQWKIFNDKYFKKDDLLIDISKCKKSNE